MSRYLSPLTHVELYTPVPDESARFLVEVAGLDEVDRAGGSVYLRCWGDYYHHGIKLTEAAQPGLAHAAWRTRSADALDEAVAALIAAGVEGRWTEGDLGHGPAYRFVGPGGHFNEIFWETELATVPVGEESICPERIQRPGRRGIAARFVDHLTVTTPDVMQTATWYKDVLDFRFMAYVENEPGAPAFFGALTTNEKSHDLGLSRDPDGYGRLHHLAFWVETREELLAAAKYVIEHGVAVEFGPGFHGIGEQDYLYIRDPGGLRYEVNTGGYRNYVPDWEPVKWTDRDGAGNGYRTGIEMPEAGREVLPSDPVAAALIRPASVAVR